LVGVRPVCELVRLSASLSVEFYTCNIKPKTKLVQYLRSTCTGFGGSGPARPCTLWSNLAEAAQEETAGRVQQRQ
jgi:hypothetical protein